MKLCLLEIENFQGVKRFVLQPEGKNADVFGKNGTGKTTLVSAISWLLFGKDALGRADFEIKPRDIYGEYLRRGDTAVRALFEVNGTELYLRKDYKEKHTKKRGSAEAEFAGHTTDHWVDGVPVQQKEFQAAVAKLADAEAFRMLSDPFYFAETLHWQKRRQMLVDICGDVTPEMVIAAEAPALDELPSILKGRSVTDLRKVLAANRKEVNGELELIPAKIDENGRNVLAKPVSLKQHLADETRLIAAIQQAEGELARLNAGGADADLRAQITQAEADLNKARTDARQAEQLRIQREREKHQKAVDDARAKVRAAEDALQLAKRTSADLGRRVSALEEDVRQSGAKLDRMREDYATIEERVFGGEVCNACGQAIPEDEVKPRREAFNLTKSKELEALLADGRALAATKQQQEKDLLVMRSHLEDANAACDAAVIALTTAKNAVPGPYVEHPPAAPGEFASDAEAKAFDTLDQLQRRLSSLTVDTTERDRLLSVIESNQVELDKVQATINDLKVQQQKSDDAAARCKELQERRVTLSQQFDLLEKHLNLLDQFDRAQSFMLGERVNGYFKLVTWQLFEEQVNGGLAPKCEALVHGIPFNAGLNNGARINAGLDIINALGRHFDFTPPVFVDNAESVNELLPTAAQVIRLVVTDTDETLRVEIK